jgi:hypothetical protein
MQIDNLRSNNSKEALTLVAEIVQNQQLEAVEGAIMRGLVAAMMAKSVSEKAFIRTQAVEGLNALPKQWNQGAFDELGSQTQSANGQISELAIRLLVEMVQNNKKYEADGKFLKILSQNLNGKRAVLQKKAKEILAVLKQREGEEQL